MNPNLNLLNPHMNLLNPMFIYNKYIKVGICATSTNVPLHYKTIKIQMAHNCKFCARVFSTSSNRIRHERLFHGDVVEDEEEDNVSVESSDSDDDDAKTEVSDEESVADEKEVSDEEMDSDDENDYWGEVIEKAASKIEVENPEKLLKEPYLSEMVDEMRQVVEKRIKFANYMQNKDAVYQKIETAKARHHEDDDDSDDEEAEETGWNDKRFLLKRVIAEHLVVVGSADSDDEDSDAEEAKDEASSADEDETDDDDPVDHLRKQAGQKIVDDYE